MTTKLVSASKFINSSIANGPRPVGQFFFFVLLVVEYTVTAVLVVLVEYTVAPFLNPK